MFDVCHEGGDHDPSPFTSVLVLVAVATLMALGFLGHWLLFGSQ